ncbi:glycosyltransferase [Flavihumibacter sediminis]|nr:glycosyltransferase [Flavihumibacter sediminis]
MGNIKVMYVGSMNQASNSYKRYKALVNMGFVVENIDLEKYVYRSLFTPLYHRISWGPGVYQLNKQVLTKLNLLKPDIVWVDNKPYLSATTLKKIKNDFPGIYLINVVTDDANGRYRSHWNLTRSTAKLYDWHFVQREENVTEYLSWGAQNVDFCFRSYDPSLHRPIELTGDELKKYHSNVGFIGSYEEDREESISFLIRNGIPVHVTGDGWENKKLWNDIKPYYKGPSVYGEEYVKKINGMDIALHFLRKGNRDQQDSRTFEIPACGTFMIAERSGLHEMFFKEDIEAVFFDSNQSLLEKVRKYQEMPEKRRLIAAAGLERCRSSGYDHESRLRNILAKVFVANNEEKV